ncbi:MAG: hypothetical protein ABJE95_33070 [Byssovorax sp.]
MHDPPSEFRRGLLSAVLVVGSIFASPAAFAQSSSPPAKASPPLAPTALPAAPRDPLAPPFLTQGTFGLAVGGVGAIAFLVGAGLGITATIKKGESSFNGHCTSGNLCDRTGAALLNTSLDYGNWSTAMFVAGSLLLTGGIVLVATAPVDRVAPSAAPPAASPPAPLSARLVVGPGSLVLSGSW